MTTIHIPLERLEANPFRDIANYQIDRHVVEDLKTSIRKSRIEGKFHGMWENFGSRPKPGTVPEQFKDLYEFLAYMQDLSAEEQIGYILENDLWFQQDSGHHRRVAAEEEGIEAINIHVRDWSDDHMLIVMALENQESFKARPFVALETVEQVLGRMESHLAENDTWEAYEAMGYNPPTFKSRKSFANAKSQGVGIKAIKSYLGDGYSDMYVRHAKNAIADVREGWYERELLKTFPTVDAIGGFHSLVNALVQKKVPDLIGRYILKEVAKIVSDQAITGKTLEMAAKQFKTNGNDPIVFLSKTVLSKLNWKKFLKNLELTDPENCMADAMVEGGEKDWINLAKEVQDEIAADVKAEEKAEAFNRKVTERAETEGVSEDDARAMIEAEAAEAAGEDDFDDDSGTVPRSEDVDLDAAGMPDVDGLGLEDGSSTTTPEATATNTAVLLGSSLSNLSAQFQGLKGKVDELDKESDQAKIFFESLETTFTDVVALMMEHVGLKEIRSRVNSIAKG